MSACVRVQSLSHVLTLCNPMHHSTSGPSLSMEFFRGRILQWVVRIQEIFPVPGTESTSPVSPELQVDLLPLEPPGKPINVEADTLFFFFVLNSSSCKNFLCISLNFTLGRDVNDKSSHTHLLKCHHPSGNKKGPSFSAPCYKSNPDLTKSIFFLLCPFSMTASSLQYYSCHIQFTQIQNLPMTTPGRIFVLFCFDCVFLFFL